ncbi:MAG: site-specific DNA-methyltransferase [Chloroflexota bacterium]
MKTNSKKRTTPKTDIKKSPEISHVKGFSNSGVEWDVFNGDALKVLKKIPDNSFDCVITSPPYFWLRDYGVDGQIGLEESVNDYISKIVKIMAEVYRTLKPKGVLFLNIGDTYYSGKGESQGIDRKHSGRRFGLRAVDKSGGLGMGLKPKTIIGIPWRIANVMISKGWILRSPIIWNRKAALPEAVKDRPSRTYEFVFMFVKDRKYFFNREALINLGEEDMWTIVARPKSNNGLGTAPFPDELVRRCISVGCPPKGKILDPFMGSGTTLRVAVQQGHSATGIDIHPKFCEYTISQLNQILL